MATTTAPLNDQQRPAEWLNRKFALVFNLFRVAKTSNDAKSFPAVTREQALGLAVLAANRVRLAQKGVAQANDVNVAGSVAAWNAELTAANAQLDTALAGVAAAYPQFRTATNCLNRLAAVAANVTAGTVKAPSQLGATWAAGTGN